MLEGIHDGGDAFDGEEGDQQQGERDRAADRPEQQDQAGDHAQDARDQRPPEAWSAPGHEGRRKAHDAAEQEQPADHQRDGDGGERRDHDGEDAEDDEDDALDQEQLPMLLDRLGERFLQLADVARICRHVGSPQTVWCLRRTPIRTAILYRLESPGATPLRGPC